MKLLIMNGVTNCFGVAVSGVAGSFFRLRPSGFCAPERPLLKRRLAGRGWICAIYASGSGCAVLPAPFSCKVICRTGWRLHAAARHTGDRMRTAHQPDSCKLTSALCQKRTFVGWMLRRSTFYKNDLVISKARLTLMTAGDYVKNCRR